MNRRIVMTPHRIEQDSDSWQAGYNAGMAVDPGPCPAWIADRLAYATGLIEGKAARERARQFDRRGMAPDYSA
jgi:hypothetical protein